jgi:hypothetical protein
MYRELAIGSIKRNIPLTCAAYVVSDLLTRCRHRVGLLGTRSGAVHLDKEIDQSIAYIEQVFAAYCDFAGTERWRGRMAEVGPGDNCGVALLLRAHGCEHVDMLDRFSSLRDPQQQAKIYQELYRRHPQLPAVIGTPTRFAEESFSGIQRHTGRASAAETFFRSHRGYDYIVSCAVMEHVQDPLGALADMSAALNPGGLMIHAVDLRDHGMFSQQHDETTFLEIPSVLYRWMTSASGRPNRVPYSSYRRILAELPLEGSLRIGSLIGERETSEYVPFEQLDAARVQRSLAIVESRKARFAAALRNLPTQDLIVSSFCLVARRR